jgi:hypothetical protein
MFDLLLTGATVIDPAQGLDAALDDPWGWEPQPQA